MSDDQDIHISEASSLIVVAPEIRKKQTTWNPNAYSMEVEDKPPEAQLDYKLLMTKRSNKSSFLASAYVFPGGHVDLEDFRLDNWLNFYARFNLLPYIEKLCHRNQQLDRPRILTNPLILGNNQLDNYLKPDIALRLTAIRETFEETGVLIAFNGEFISDYRFELGQGNFYTNEYLVNRNCEYIEELSKRPEMKTWREEIKKDANKFYQFCVHFDLVPNIFLLHEWWNWQTPITLGHKLFDTILYVTFLPKKLSSTVDNSEVSKIEWLKPEEMLKEHLEKKAFIAPPQIYELSRLANFQDYASLMDFTLKREKYGIERWSYQITAGWSDGALLALPGDEMYIEEGNELPVPESSNVTLSDLRTKANRMNRIELKVPVGISYCRNVKMPHGQVSPITFDNSKSKL